MASNSIALPPGATLVDQQPMALPPGATLVQQPQMSALDRVGAYLKGSLQNYADQGRQRQQRVLAGGPLITPEESQAAARSAEMAIPTAGLQDLARAAASKASASVSALNAIPNKLSAGQKFADVASVANSQPVSLTNAQQGAVELMDWQKKTQLGPTINKFLNRITNPKLGPMTYEEGRDFYQLLGKLSSDEASKLAGPVRRSLVQMVVGLKQDLGAAAGSVGKAEDYYSALKEYSHAQTLGDLVETLQKWGVRGAIGAAAGKGALSLFNQVNSQF